MAQTNRDVDLLKLLRKGESPDEESGAGLFVVKVITAQPSVTLLFEGSQVPIDMDLFEVPYSLLPLVEGKRYFTLPIAGNGQRWGILTRIDE